MKRAVTAVPILVKGAADGTNAGLPSAQHSDLKRERSTAPPPPMWTRYMDSRLKQFCVR